MTVEWDNGTFDSEILFNWSCIWHEQEEGMPDWSESFPYLMQIWAVYYINSLIVMIIVQ